MPVKEATCRTPVSVTLFIIGKAFRWIDALLVVVAQTAAQVTHVRADALAGQGDEVRARAIFAIGHHRPRFARRVCLVLGKQMTQFRSVIADPIGGLTAVMTPNLSSSAR